VSEPFLGEIRLFGFSFAPRSWAKCDGQLLAISQNQSLFSILGTTYGGDGRNTFALPDLRGRVPRQVDTGLNQGTVSGSEAVPLTTAAVPPHTHSLRATSDNATSSSPTGNVYAKAGTTVYRDTADALVDMNSGAIGATGGGQGHDNMQPFQVISFCIAVTGLFPPRN